MQKRSNVGKKQKRVPRIDQEFGNVQLGDGRLEQRCMQIIRELNAKPSASTINGTFEKWADTKASYNFWLFTKICG